MSVAKIHPAFCQRFDGRRLDLRVPAQRFNPIIQVVNDDHQHIGACWLICHEHAERQYRQHEHTA